MKNIVHAFAAYIMRGRFQSILVATACAVLSLTLFPLTQPISHLSAASVSLVTLREGLRNGLIVIVGSTLVAGLLGALSTRDMNTALIFIVLFGFLVWVPVWVVSGVLRFTRALDMALVTASILGIFFIIAMYLYVEDVTAWWSGILRESFVPALENTMMTGEEINALIQQAADVMTGWVAAAFVMGTMISLLLARWLQSILYYPGGFRKEFHALRFNRNVAIAALAIALLSMLPVEMVTDISHDIFAVIIVTYMLHGLALAHAVVAMLNVHVAWLVVVYILVLFLPQVLILLAAAGFADSWMDFRPRIAARGRDRNIDHDE